MNCPVTFISIPYSVITNDIVTEYDTETGVNILLDSNDIRVPLIIDVVKRFNFHFIFSLSDSMLSSEIDSLLPSLYTLFTLSGCFAKCDYSIPVFLSGLNSEVNLQKIKDYFLLQGEKNIKFTIFEPADLQVKNTTLLSTASQLKKLDEDQIQKYISLKISQIILSSGNRTQLETTKKENKYVDLLLRITSLNNTARWNQHESELWQNRAKLYLSFIALGKEVGQKEYYDIKEWYHQEYEILPLWFKRLGHVVKAFMGKRSFKSLFSDNVKK